MARISQRNNTFSFCVSVHLNASQSFLGECYVLLSTPSHGPANVHIEQTDKIGHRCKNGIANGCLFQRGRVMNCWLVRGETPPRAQHSWDGRQHCSDPELQGRKWRDWGMDRENTICLHIIIIIIFMFEEGLPNYNPAQDSDRMRKLNKMWHLWDN